MLLLHLLLLINWKRSNANRSSIKFFSFYLYVDLDLSLEYIKQTQKLITQWEGDLTKQNVIIDLRSFDLKGNIFHILDCSLNHL